MICPNCFSENKDSAARCKACGADLYETPAAPEKNAFDDFSAEAAAEEDYEAPAEEPAPVPYIRTVRKAAKPAPANQGWFDDDDTNTPPPRPAPPSLAPQEEEEERPKRYAGRNTSPAPGRRPARREYLEEDYAPPARQPAHRQEQYSAPYGESEEELGATRVITRSEMQAAEDRRMAQSESRRHPEPENTYRPIRPQVSPYRDESGSASSYRGRQETDFGGVSPALHNYAKRQKGGRTAITIIIWVLILALLGGGIFLGYRLLDGKIFNPTAPTSTPAPGNTGNIQAPQISVMQEEDGTEFVRAIFYGVPQDSIYIAPLNKYFPFESSVLTFNWQLHELLGNAQPEGETVTINLAPVYRTKAGKETPIDTLPVTMKVAMTSIKLLSPALFSNEVYQTDTNIVFQVTPGAAIDINGTDYTAKADASGKVTYKATCQPGEQKDFLITAKATGKQPAGITVTLFREKMPVTFSLSASNPKTVQTNQVVISGNVDKLATLSVEDYKVLDVKINEQYGMFDLTVELPAYGTHNLILSATVPETGTSKLAFSVVYQPDEHEYTKKAWAYDKNLAKNPEGFLGKIFVFESPSVVEVKEGSPNIITINMGTEDSPQLLLLEYAGSRKIEVGGRYRFFADVIGQQDGKALLAVRFTYAGN